MAEGDNFDRAFERIASALQPIDVMPYRADWKTIRRICAQLPFQEQEDLLFAISGLLLREYSRHSDELELLASKRTEAAAQKRKDVRREAIVLRIAKERMTRNTTKQRSTHFIANCIFVDVNSALLAKGCQKFGSAGTLRKYLDAHLGWGARLKDIFRGR